MANGAPQTDDNLTPELMFGSAPIDLEQKAAELEKRKALARRAGSPDYLEKQNVGPQTEFKGMEHPEMGETPEMSGQTPEEGEEEEGGGPGEQGGEEGEENEEPEEEQQEDQDYSMTGYRDPFMKAYSSGKKGGREAKGANRERELRATIAEIQKQMRNIEGGVARQLKEPKKKMQEEYKKDRNKNAKRIIQFVGGFGLTYWWTLIAPTLAIFIIFAVIVIAFLAGLNLGSKSLQYMTARMRYESVKKQVFKNRDRQFQYLRPELQKAMRELNQSQAG